MTKKKPTPWLEIKTEYLKGCSPKELIKFIRSYEKNKNYLIAQNNANIQLMDFKKGINGYYIYFLINPITNQIFYIGKGKNNRALQHLTAVLKNKEKNIFKKSEIEKILKQKKKPLVKIFCNCLNDEELAYKIETKLIKRFYTSLTNISQNEDDFCIRKQIESILKRMPTYKEWLLGIKYNRPLIFEIISKQDYGKSLYFSAVNCLLRLAKEYKICLT